MLSRKKIAAVSGLLGGLAVTCAGVAQAYGASDPGVCTRDTHGNVTCVQRIEGEVSEDGFIPRQEQCLPTQPLTLPAAVGGGKMHIGPEVTCSTSMPVDRGDRGDRGDKGDMELPTLLG
ncbi:hypothetical protein J2Z21_003356 [Streptomyces griseochromogenes]|uniref:Intersectin-EH binding protein Ibp1 n=1 Tax=Streptomyces griseochromogenes TaxID=68214 RepID=A0A1B1B8I9_9ACTN|nr:hypothetical protein [Streptomyces griseochromogenes]ANP55150.1 hypothetical protein AVL59_41150 [Streptomyces griseochromogenes]MBP2050417.1 hypothetical protein [Streptomyces griseochromogenes]